MHHRGASATTVERSHRLETSERRDVSRALANGCGSSQHTEQMRDDGRKLDLDWVTGQLAVGGRFAMAHAGELAALGVRAVVDCRGEDCDDEEVLGSHGMMLLHLPTVDRCAVSLEMLERGVRWVHEHLSRGAKVVIHCEHGIGRSALLLCCVLVSATCSPLEALTRAKDTRACVSPSPEQLQGYLAYCRAWRARNEAAWEVPSFDSLAAVAYRHLRDTTPAGA